MTERIEKAYAKLNITLDVLSRLESGYHAMKMILQTCTLCDDVLVSVRPGAGEIRVSSDRDYLPRDGDNLAGKAARLFLESTRLEGLDVTVGLVKRIPVCAGLGGGSADAAAVLRALNALTETGFPREKLEEIGAAVGSDVPFCVAGGTALGEGRGEVLTPLPAFPPCAFVLCKPDFSISTPELFSRLDGARIRCRPDTERAAAAIAGGSAAETARYMYNVFEDVLGRRSGAVSEIKNDLCAWGAAGAVMSGTGSAVFGVFPDRAQARRAQAALKEKVPFCAYAEPAGRI